MATNISRDFTRRTDLGSYGLQKSRDAERREGEKGGGREEINAITARRMTSVTSADPERYRL